jgi:hypothetical protein
VLPTSGTCNSTENGVAVAWRAVHHILEQAGVRVPAKGGG